MTATAQSRKFGSHTGSAGAPQLHRTIITVLLNSRYAGMFGRSRRERALNISLIASAYSREEFLAEPGIGPAKVDQVQRWLEVQGLQFRGNSTPMASCDP